MVWFFTRPAKDPSLAELPEHDPTSPLSIHAMTIAYNQRPVLWDVEYDAPSAALIAIVGPNGAGKSTLIKGCLEIINRATGSVFFWGQPLAQVRQRVGYVPQRTAVDWSFPISSLEAVAMGRYAKIGWCKPVGKADYIAARELLDRVGMAQFADRQISQLSGGQQQRVFLARALAQEADLYLMDEPFAGVDAATERAIIEVLTELQRQGKTVICVHHDLVTVPEYFTHVVLLNTRIVAAGTVEDTFTQENIRRTYGGKLTLLEKVSDAIANSALGER